ncbi:MAG: hypothetical protein ACYC27_03440 [Armatimonadota bacterium]
MVDREGRDRLAFALRQFMAGRISEHKWEESLPDRTKDEALDDIADHLEFWFENIYGPDYTLNGLGDFSGEDRKNLAICLAFLYSDVDYGETEKCSAVEIILGFIALPLFVICCLGESIYRWLFNVPDKKEDDNPIWPFRQQSDLDDVLSKPRLLNGKRYSSC